MEYIFNEEKKNSNGVGYNVFFHFRHHKECPVTGCSCKCMSLDAVANLKSLTSS